MTDQVEGLVAQVGHHFQLILRCSPLAVRLRVVSHHGFAAVAVAPQVGRDDGVAFCQNRRYLVPHYMGLRVAMQQERRRAAAAAHEVDDRFGGLYPLSGKCFKQHPPSMFRGSA